MPSYLSDVQILNNVYDDRNGSISKTSNRWVQILGPVTSSTAGSGDALFSGWLPTAGFSEMQFAARIASGISATNAILALDISLNGTDRVGGAAYSYASSTGGAWNTSNGGLILSIGGGNKCGYSFNQASSPRHVVQGGFLPPYVRLSWTFAAGTQPAGSVVWYLHGRKS